MRVSFKLFRGLSNHKPFLYSFCRAQENPLSDSPVKGGNVESRCFDTQDDLTNHLNNYYWMFFGTEEAQKGLKTFLKGAGKAKKKGECFELTFSFETFTA